ncbi:MAG: 50S ribosomal protein L10 [Bacillota bacterium]
MANAQNISMKAAKVAEIKEKLQKAQSIVVFDYRGLTVEEVTALRNEMRKAGVDYEVIKNAIVERAAQELGIPESVHSLLKGPSAFAFGYEDAAAPAKILKELVRKLKKCEMKGGIVNGAIFDQNQVNALADLPSREQLIARLLGSMMSPISGLAIVLDQIAKSRGGAEPAQAAE